MSSVAERILSSPEFVRDAALLRCVSSFQPSEPKEPLLMSDSDGAFDAVVPAAAMKPCGGFDSRNFVLAVRIMFETAEALVDVRSRGLVEGDSAGGAVVFGLRRPSGCGNGTGVGVLAFGDAMVVGVVG